MISILKKLKHQSKLFELYKFVTGRIEEAQLKQVASTLTPSRYLLLTEKVWSSFFFPPCFRNNTAYK